MVEIDGNVQPVYRRERDALTVQLTLKGDPDGVWQSLFAAMSQQPDQPDYALIIGEAGTNLAAVSVPVPLSMTDEAATALMRKFDQFVDEVEKIHGESTAASVRLERAISGLFGSQAHPLTNRP